MSEKPQNSFTNPNLQHVVTPEQGGGRVSEKPNPSTGELDQIPTLSTAPETAAALLPAVEADKPWYRTTAAKIGAGAVGLVLAAGAVFGVNTLNEVSEKPPVATAPADSGEVPPVAEQISPFEQELTVEAMQIPAGLSAEDFAEVLIAERYTTWGMAGATYENKDAWIEGGGGRPFIEAIAERNAAVAAEALFIDGWRENPRLVDALAFDREQNVSSVQYWLSFNEELGDREPYVETLTIQSVTVIGEGNGIRTLEIVGVEHNNSAMNRVGIKFPEVAAQDGKTFTWEFTTKVVDGFERISDFN